MNPRLWLIAVGVGLVVGTSTVMPSCMPTPGRRSGSLHEMRRAPGPPEWRSIEKRLRSLRPKRRDFASI
jgi:hypothetical protein